MSSPSFFSQRMTVQYFHRCRQLPAAHCQYHFALRTVMVRKQVPGVPTDNSWLLSGRSRVLPLLSRMQIRVGRAGGRARATDVAGWHRGHFGAGPLPEGCITRSTEWRRPILTCTLAVAAALTGNTTGSAAMYQRRTSRCCGASLPEQKPRSNTHTTQAQEIEAAS